MFRSDLVKVSLPLYFVFALSFLSASAYAQSSHSGNQQVKVKISRSEDGTTSSIERTHPVNGSVNVGNILRRYEVTEELGNLPDGEAIEIVIRRKRRVGEDAEIKIEVEPVITAPAPRTIAREEPKPVAPPKAKPVPDVPFLGVKYEDLDVQNPMILEIPEVRGILVTDVLKNTSADESGLETGDLIAAVNDIHLDDSHSIIDLLHRYNAGDEVELIYYRDAKKKKARIVLGEKGNHKIYGYEVKDEDGGKIDVATLDGSDAKEIEANLEDELGERIVSGASIPPPPPSPADLPPSERAFLGVNGMAGDDSEGARVSGTLRNSTAAELGLKEGDLIISLNGAPITKFEDLNMIMEFISPNDFITVEFIRNEESRSASARIKTKMQTYTMPAPPARKPEPVAEQAPGGTAPQSSIEVEPMWEVYREVVTKIVVEDVLPSEAESISRRAGHEMSTQNNLDILDLNLYPNPNQGMFNLVFDLPADGDVQIRFLNMEGKLIYAEDLPGFSGKYEKALDFSDKEKGIYFLRIVQNGQGMLKKIVLQ